MVIAVVVLIVQWVAASSRPALKPALPATLTATGAALLTGLWLLFASEFRWVTGTTLDGWALPVIIAALAWMWWNRLSRTARRMGLTNTRSKPDS